MDESKKIEEIEKKERKEMTTEELEKLEEDLLNKVGGLLQTRRQLINEYGDENDKIMGQGNETPIPLVREERPEDEAIYIANHIADGKSFLLNPCAETFKSRVRHPNVVWDNEDLMHEHDKVSACLQDGTCDFNDPIVIKHFENKVKLEKEKLKEVLKLADPMQLQNRIAKMSERYAKLKEHAEKNIQKREK